VALWNLDEVDAPAQSPKNFDHKNAQGGSGRIFSVAVNPAKPQFVTVSLDNVRLWNSQAEQAEQKPIFLRPDPPRNRIFRAAFSRDGNYLIAGTISGAPQIWDVRRKTTKDKGDYVLGPLGAPVYHIGDRWDRHDRLPRVQSCRRRFRYLRRTGFQKARCASFLGHATHAAAGRSENRCNKTSADLVAGASGSSQRLAVDSSWLPSDSGQAKLEED
jgi:WD40 repeat protein